MIQLLCRKIISHNPEQLQLLLCRLQKNHQVSGVGVLFLVQEQFFCVITDLLPFNLHIFLLFKVGIFSVDLSYSQRIFLRTYDGTLGASAKYKGPCTNRKQQ